MSVAVRTTRPCIALQARMDFRTRVTKSLGRRGQHDGQVRVEKMCSGGGLACFSVLFWPLLDCTSSVTVT